KDSACPLRMPGRRTRRPTVPCTGDKGRFVEQEMGGGSRDKKKLPRVARKRPQKINARRHGLRDQSDRRPTRRRLGKSWKHIDVRRRWRSAKSIPDRTQQPVGLILHGGKMIVKLIRLRRNELMPQLMIRDV